MLAQVQACKPTVKSQADSSSQINIEIKPLIAEEILNLVKKSGQEFTLVNYWASWCQPCREEFPELIRFKKDWANKGIAFEFVSVDFNEDIAEAKSFLNSQAVDFLTYIKNGEDDSFIKVIDPKWSGALPTTFIYDRTGKQVKRIDGPTSFDELSNFISELRNKEKIK